MTQERGRSSPRERLSRVGPLLVPVILIVVLLGPHLLGLRSLAPTDQLYNWEPWHSEMPADLSQTHNAPFSDNFDSIFPVRQELVDRIRSGDWPLWSTLSGGGSDLADNIGSAAAAPSNAVALVTPGWYTPALLKALELLGAWGFVFLFLRRVGTGRWPASLAGAVFALSGFQVVWVNWPHTRVAMFSAGVLWSFDRLIEKASPGRIAVASTILAATVLEGFPAVAVTGIGAAAILLGVRLVQLSTGTIDAARRAVVAAGALLLGGAITAVVTLPFSSRLTAIAANRAVPADFGAARALGTVFAPNALGRADSYFGPLNYIEMVGFLGATAFALIVAGVASLLVQERVRRPSTIEGRDVLLMVAVLAGGVMLAYSYGIEPVYDLFRRFPVLSSNSPGRVKAPALLLLSLASGLGLDTLIKAELNKVQRLVVVGITAVATATTCVYLYGFAELAEAASRGFVRGEIARAMVVALTACGAVAVIVVGTRSSSWRNGAIGALVLLVMFDAVAWVIPYWPRSEPDEFYPVTDGHEFLAESLGQERFAALGLTFFPGTSAYYGLRSPIGHVFYRQSWIDAIEAAGALMRSPTFASFEDPASASSPVLDRLGVSYWADPAGLERCLDISDDDLATSRSTRSLSLTTEGPGVRGITFVPAASLPADTRLELRARPTTGRGDTITAVRELDDPSPPGEPITVVAPRLEKISGSVDLELTSNRALPDLVDDPMPCLAQDDGLVLEHAGGTWIYRRTNALASIRWASNSVVSKNPQKRVQLLRSGDVSDDTVVLSEDSDTTEGGTGRIVSSNRGQDRINVVVDAEGPGFVVVADPLQAGWVAEIDGERVDLLDADHAGVAVHVDQGRHEIVLSYEPDGYRTGVVVSGAALLIVLGLISASVASRLRSRGSHSAASANASESAG